MAGRVGQKVHHLDTAVTRYFSDVQSSYPKKNFSALKAHLTVHVSQELLKEQAGRPSLGIILDSTR